MIWRAAALATLALMGGCVFSSETPLFRASQGMALFADAQRLEWREDGRDSDKRTIVMHRRGDSYDIEMIGEEELLHDAMFVPISATPEDDYVVQLRVMPDSDSVTYAFLWAIDGGYRVIADPGEAEAAPGGARVLHEQCAARPNSECEVRSAAALDRIYRAGLYPRFVSGGETPSDYIDLVAAAAAGKDAP